MTKAVSEYMAKIGRRGGKAASGAKKARSSAQCRAAAKKRWDKYYAAQEKAGKV